MGVGITRDRISGLRLSSAANIQSNFVGVVGRSPAVGEYRKRSVPTGWTRSRSDGTGAVRIGQAAKAAVKTVDGADRTGVTRVVVVVHRSNG